MTHIPAYADATAFARRTPVRSAAFVQLHSGYCVDLLAPELSDLRLTDLATHLARLPRFLGATRGDHAYSVAQHSVLVALLLRDETLAIRRAGLLHDAHEALMGGIATPVKAALGREQVHELERRLAMQIHARFGLSSELFGHARVAEADRVALATERRDLLAPSAWRWPAEGAEPAAAMQLEPWPASKAHALFLTHAAGLGLR